MQETGSTSPLDKGSDQNPSAAEETDSVPGSQSPRRPQRTSDPVVRWLIFAIFGVVILWLVAFLSALMFGVVMPTGAPRTEAERNLSLLTAQVDTGKATTQVYAQYIGALISAGQLSKAQSALDQSLKVAKTDRSYLLMEQTELDMANQDYKAAVTAADQAMAEAQKELKAFEDDNIKNNRVASAGAVLPTSYSTAALDKATALLQSKDYAGEIKALDVYLVQQPTDSDILVMRAQAKAKVGDKQGAANDYRAALKYIPDFQPALDGLKQIGVAQ
jgi:predicted Zn-dependent protease